MASCDTLIINATIVDGSGGPPVEADVAVSDGLICAIGALSGWDAKAVVDGSGKVLSPGFIDSHTHDDTSVVRAPEMWPKLSQGVTTVIVGNCGISAAPVTLAGDPPDPMNLLGSAAVFQYPDFGAYVEAVNSARPAVNVAAFIGHTALRSNHMDRLDRPANQLEINAMREQLREALAHGSLGLSTGLAYENAIEAPCEEVIALAEPLAEAGGIYATHMRNESGSVLEAIDEACRIGREARVPVVISHLKCAGIENWGRGGEVLAALDSARSQHPVGWDCYPYAASSTTLDLRQVTGETRINITCSVPHPETSGESLADIAAKWELDLWETARRLQPAGAIYHSMSEHDVRRILGHPGTMIGSDGLPYDQRPHPRLWGTFPRILGYYVREQKLFPLAESVHKMTGLPAKRFGLTGRGLIRGGYCADLVLFDADTVRDVATFENPRQAAEGIQAVWVNGVLSTKDSAPTHLRGGRFLPRSARPAGWLDNLV
jgi:N-acyl-D-amino-acid deacylase